MDTTVNFCVRNVYGNRTAYPVNEQASRLADLVGSKTLTPSTLAIAQRMGFTVTQVPDPKMAFSFYGARS